MKLIFKGGPFLMAVAFCAVVAGAAPATRPAAGESTPPTFVKKPVAAAKGDTVELSFAVDRSTDVAVDVLDAGGKVVRRLGGAMLGLKNDPPPPFQPGVEQTVSWDRKDNVGKPAVGGPFKFRVRLGLKADFDRFIGWEGMPPLDLPMAMMEGAAVGPDRTLYVICNQGMIGNAGRSETRICAFSKEGKFLRTVYPYPATTDPAKLRGADLLRDTPNRLEPRVYDRVCPSFLPQMRAVLRQTMAMTSDGRMIFANGFCTELYKFGPRCLLVMNTDGTIPRERLDGPTIAEGVVPGFVHLALSPDEKSVYFTGLTGKGYQHVVYRTGLGLADKPEVVFGVKDKPSADKDGLNNPRGLATDKKGRVYVSDFSNNRIVVLDASGKYQAELPVTGPEVIVVHPKSGAIYVVSMLGKDKYKLVKLAGASDPQVVAELDLTKFGGVKDPVGAPGYSPELALDSYGETPLIYLTSGSGWSNYRILRIEDGGAALNPTRLDMQAKGQIKGFPYPQGVDGNGNFYFLNQDGTDPSRDPRGGTVVVAGSGELKPWKCPSKQYRCEVGKDNLVYMGVWFRSPPGSKDLQTYGLQRTDLEGKATPFPATGAESEHYLGRGWRFDFLRGNLCIHADGNIWGLYGSDVEPPLNNMRVASLGPDGKIKNKELVQGLTCASSLRVDSRGNIFVSDGINLDGKPYPPEIEEFVKKLRAKGTTSRGQHSEAPEDCYGEGYGTIIKFGADGGKLVPGATAGAGDLLFASYPGKNKFVASGVKGTYPRISPMSPPRGGEFSACWCLHAIFDIDGYDRLFVPDALQFRIRVLDANFNEITTFGDYDSASARGGNENAPGPAIPLEFPTQVHTAGDEVFVTDTASCARRIVGVKLSYAAEGTCVAQ